MGGTGTAVIKTSPNVELAKEFLAFARLSKEGNVQLWKILGFDPIRKDVYSMPELTEPNAFFDFFGDDLFEVVSSMLDDVPNTCLTDMFPSAADIVKNQMAYKLVVERVDPETIAKECAEELRNMIY